MTITVFLADDQAVIRDGLRLLLEMQPDIQVVGDAANGRETVQQVSQLHPDVVIMDIAMPELNGIEATRLLHETCPLVQVVMLSMYSTTEHIMRALHAGASGFVLKESAGSEIVSAVRAVHAGNRYLCQKMAASVPDEDYPQTEVTKGEGTP